MKRILFFFGIVLPFLFGVSPSVSAQQAPNEQDLYLDIYEQLAIDPYTIALAHVAKQLAITSGQLRQALENPSVQSLAVISFPSCQIRNLTDVGPCYEFVTQQFAREYTFSLEQINTAEVVGGLDRWMNGTLQDSSFDIIVDLNIIDVILFGPKAEVPEARLPGRILDALPFAGVPRPSTPVAPLLPPGSTTPGSGGSGSFPPGGDGNGQNPGDNGNGEDPQMCIDPEVLFFPGDSNGSAGGEGETNGEGGNDTEGSQTDELPDLSGAGDNFAYGSYPDISSIEEPEACAGEQIPLFNGLYCIPKFCTDLICVFIHTTPGRAFALGPQETPACVECIVEKGLQIVKTLDATVEAPQDAQNTRFSFRNFLSAFAKQKMGVQFVKKAPPQVRTSPEKNKPANTVVSTDDNYKLALLILDENCQAVIDAFPPKAAVNTEEILQMCETYKKQKDPKKLRELVEKQALALTIDDEVARQDIDNEGYSEILRSLQQFRQSMASFTAAVGIFSPELLKEVDQSAPNK